MQLYILQLSGWQTDANLVKMDLETMLSLCWGLTRWWWQLAVAGLFPLMPRNTSSVPTL